MNYETCYFDAVDENKAHTQTHASLLKAVRFAKSLSKVDDKIIIITENETGAFPLFVVDRTGIFRS
jgi:hypothetical protein